MSPTRKLRRLLFASGLLAATIAGCGDSTTTPDASKGKMDGGGAMDPGKAQGGAMDKGKMEGGGAMDPGKMDGGAMDKGKMDGGAMDKGKMDGAPK